MDINIGDYKKMNVLHINCNYITTKLHSVMIEHLNQMNIKNTIFIPTYNEQTVTIKKLKDNELVSKCFEKNDRFLFWLKQKKIIKAIEKECDINSFEIIHAYTLFTDGNCAMKLSQKYNVPYVVAIRNTDINIFFKYRIFLRKRGIEILKNASAIFFLSNAYKRKLFEKYIPEKYKNELLKKTEIIPNGIDDFWHINSYIDENRLNNKIKRIKEKEIKLIYAGNIDKNKNISKTCEAIKRLEKEGWKVNFTVAGKIKNEKIYKRVKDKIEYKGILNEKELIEYYRESDIFVMPSKKETFGLVYAEAMSQGLPVIYTMGQGFDEQFEEGVVGFRVNENDEKDIVNAIKAICNRYDIISNNCIKMITKFSWKRICIEYYNKYDNIINKVPKL